MYVGSQAVGTITTSLMLLDSTHSKLEVCMKTTALMINPISTGSYRLAASDIRARNRGFRDPHLCVIMYSMHHMLSMSVVNVVSLLKCAYEA